MRINEIEFTDAVPVEGYGPGFFRVGETVHSGPMLMSGKGPRTWGGLEDADALLALVGQIDVLFVGMGEEIAHLPTDLRNQLEAEGIGVEVMSSPAACRTYNVLLSEGRRVAIAVLPV